MYKIYIGTVPLQLVSTEEVPAYQTGDLRHMVLRHTPRKRKTLHQIIDNLEKGTQSYDSVTVYHDDLAVLWDDFSSLYEIRHAGGGVVYNPDGALLAIQRMGYWDLPKGKQEDGETIEETALREVEEETGATALTLGAFLMHTYHTNRCRKGKRILKYTTWYKMGSDNWDLTPQAEEDIEQAIWLPLEDFLQKRPIYNNILDILNQL